MTMRITDNYLASVLVRDSNRSLAGLLKLQRMAATLRRVTSYADDPVAVGTIQRYGHLIQANAQYLKNLDRSRLFVEATDSALQSITEVLSEARALALQESSVMGSAESNRLAAEQVDHFINRLMDSLNVTVEGNFIFGGYRTSVPPFVRQGNEVNYQGDAGEILARLGRHASIVVNTPGEAFLGTDNSRLIGTTDMAPRLDPAVSLVDLNLGEGWVPGRFRLTDGTGTTHTIDVSTAATLADVIARIEADSGGALTAGIAEDGEGLQISGTGPLQVSEVDGGGTAASLGLTGESSAGFLIGGDIRAAPAPATPLSQIASLQGGLPLGEIRITLGENEFTVDLSSAATVGDLQSLLGAAVPELEIQIDGSALVVVGGGTDSFTISNGDAGGTATLLGLAGVGSPSRLFGVMTGLKEALLAGDKTAIRASLAELAAVEQRILAEIVKVGGKENSLDWMEGLLRQRAESLQQNLSGERDADLARVATDLSKAEAAYQATLLVTSRLFEVNLMQYLR